MYTLNRGLLSKEVCMRMEDTIWPRQMQLHTLYSLVILHMHVCILIHIYTPIVLYPPGLLRPCKLYNQPATKQLQLVKFGHGLWNVGYMSPYMSALRILFQLQVRLHTVYNISLTSLASSILENVANKEFLWGEQGEYIINTYIRIDFTFMRDRQI